MLGRCDPHIMSVNGQVGQWRVMEIAADYREEFVLEICAEMLGGNFDTRQHGVYAVQRRQTVPALVYCPCS